MAVAVALGVPARGLESTLGLVDASEKPDSTLPVSNRNNPIWGRYWSTARRTRLGWKATAPRHLHLEGLQRRLAHQAHDAGARRVHLPVSPPRSARGVPAHPPLRLPCQRLWPDTSITTGANMRPSSPNVAAN